MLVGHDAVVEAVDAFDDLLRDAYWKHKDVVAALQIGRAGIRYCQDQAADANDAIAQKEVIGGAKTLCYDLASFCWVGWDELGVAISDQAAQAGRDAAKKDLELAERLGVVPMPMSRSLWMHGAYHLTDGEYAQAKQCFESAAEHAQRGGVEAEQFLSEGYAAVAICLDPGTARVDREAHGDTFAAIKGRLIEGEQVQSLVDQLHTAKAVCRR